MEEAAKRSSAGVETRGKSAKQTAMTVCGASLKDQMLLGSI